MVDWLIPRNTLSCFCGLAVMCGTITNFRRVSMVGDFHVAGAGPAAWAGPPQSPSAQGDFPKGTLRSSRPRFSCSRRPPHLGRLRLSTELERLDGPLSCKSPTVCVQHSRGHYFQPLGMSAERDCKYFSGMSDSAPRRLNLPNQTFSWVSTHS